MKRVHTTRGGRSLQVLSRYIARRRSLAGKNILELGSGTGLVGLVAGMLGAHVWITDQAFVVLPRACDPTVPKITIALSGSQSAS